MSWLWCVEQHCDYYKWTLTREAGLPVDPESLKVTYTDPSSTRVDDRCAFSCVRVNHQNWFSLHEDSFWIDFSAQRVSSKHLWYAARIQLSVLCFRLIVDWYQSWLSGMLGNVGECAAVESGSGIPSFAALPETRPPQINQISTAEVETFVCDWQISAGGGVKWGGGHWQRGTWTYSAAVRTETTKQLLAYTYCTYTMYILFLMCALLQKHSLADKELFLKSCFRIWCAGISLSYKKTQTFSQDYAVVWKINNILFASRGIKWN